MIPFNRQNIFGKELEYIKDAYETGKISGDGKYTELCNSFMEKRFNAKKIMLTTSGTHALDLSAILSEIKPGDEIIMPSYTFVTTANAFVLRGGKPVFCDIRKDNLNMDETIIEELVTEKTKAIVPVHYAGVACDMDKIMRIAKKNDLMVIEDAAQGVNAKYKDKYLGTIGDIGCYSFHETKNYSMGEGGAIVINNEELFERAEIVREKGTNRKKFFRGEIDKYTWVDIGSSYLPSEINAAILWNQLEHIDEIQEKRKDIFEMYYDGLKKLENDGKLRLPIINDYAECNYHMFYMLMKSEKERDEIISYLKKNGIQSVFHYIPLHTAPFIVNQDLTFSLTVTEELSKKILRLPMFYSLTSIDQQKIIDFIYLFFEENA